MEAKRKMELRDAIVLGATFLAVTIGNHFDVPVPQWANDFLAASDATVWGAVVFVGMYVLRVLSRNFPGLDKILHLGNVFPEKEIEHTGAEKLLQLHVAMESNEVVVENAMQQPEPDALVESWDSGAEDDDDDYLDWAAAAMDSLGE